MLVIEEESLTATSNQATLKSSLKRRISPTRSVSKETKITVEDGLVSRENSRKTKIVRITRTQEELEIEEEIEKFERFCSIAFYCAFFSAAMFMTYILVFVRLS